MIPRSFISRGNYRQKLRDGGLVQCLIYMDAKGEDQDGIFKKIAGLFPGVFITSKQTFLVLDHHSQEDMLTANGFF